MRTISDDAVQHQLMGVSQPSWLTLCPRYTTNGLPGRYLDGHLSTLRPSLLDPDGRARCRYGR